MSLIPKQLGATPKQVAILGGLLVVLVIAYIMNRDSSQPEASVKRSVATPADPVSPPIAAPRPRSTAEVSSPGPRAPTRGSRSVQDFRPSLKLPEGTDVSRIDPTLRLDLLAKLQKVSFEGGSRSVFDFGQAPPAAPPPNVTIKPGPILGADGKPIAPVPLVPITQAPPPPPAIPLKFYGYANSARGGPKRAFFIEGDDIFIAVEGELVHNRYKIIRIGINSAVVEDTTNHNQQTIRLLEEMTQ